MKGVTTLKAMWLKVIFCSQVRTRPKDGLTQRQAKQGESGRPPTDYEPRWGSCPAREPPSPPPLSPAVENGENSFPFGGYCLCDPSNIFKEVRLILETKNSAMRGAIFLHIADGTVLIG